MALSIASVLMDLDRFAKTSAVFLGVTTATVALRLWARSGISKRIGLDDYAIMVAWLCCVGTNVISVEINGLILDLVQGRRRDIGSLIPLAKAGLCLYIWSMIFLKISLGLFFAAIFTAHTVQRVIIHFIVITSILSGIAYFSFSIASCALNHGFIQATGECSTWKAYVIFGIVWSSYNAFTDMVFAIMSCHAIWTANFPIRTRLLASTILVLGTVGGVASIIRVVILVEAQADLLILVSGLHLGFWTLMESGIGITAACLACLRPLLRLFRDKLFSSLPRSSSTERYETADAPQFSRGMSRSVPGLSSALTDREPPVRETRDWRNDVITKDEQQFISNAGIIGSIFTIQEDGSGGNRRSLQTHGLG